MATRSEAPSQVSDFPSLTTLRTLLAEHYGVRDPARITLTPLREHARKRIYLVGPVGQGSVDTGGIVGPIEPPDPARLQALLAGYRQHHALTSGELAHLADAIRFRTLVGACANLARAVRDARPDAVEPWWWQRCEMAEDLADRVRTALGA
jgi:hypothetical protein